jgi:hypothetical protein
LIDHKCNLRSLEAQLKTELVIERRQLLWLW